MYVILMSFLVKNSQKIQLIQILRVPNKRTVHIKNVGEIFFEILLKMS